MRIGREALNFTNPGARYIVLTDRETAPYLEKDFEVKVLAPSGWPLMRQFVEAQRAYCDIARGTGPSLLAGTDCAANRKLDDAFKYDLGITYRPRGRHRINNIAYITDHEFGSWFLERAMLRMEPDDYDYYGDQASWEAVCGHPEDWELLNPEDEPDGLRRVRVDNYMIYLLPCRKYNYFRKMAGAMDKIPEEAYLIHYKGPRKNIMVASVKRHILHKRTKDGVPMTKWKTYPMQERIGDD
jgi:hypothetical protein